MLLIRRIRDLLYDQGFTISGARNQLGDLLGGGRLAPPPEGHEPGLDDDGFAEEAEADDAAADDAAVQLPIPEVLELAPSQLRAELLSIRELLAV